MSPKENHGLGMARAPKNNVDPQVLVRILFDHVLSVGLVPSFFGAMRRVFAGAGGFGEKRCLTFSIFRCSTCTGSLEDSGSKCTLRSPKRSKTAETYSDQNE